MTRLLTTLALLSLVFLLPVACEKPEDSPRERVLDFVRLVQSDSLADILPYVDPDSLAFYLYFDEKYDSMTLADKRNAMLRGFTRNGEHRRMITGSQMVINNVKNVDDSTAMVEVSYIDLKTRIQYYTWMGLKKRAGIWFITNLRVE